MVVVGVGSSDGVSTVVSAGRTGADSAAVQYVYAIAGGRLARTVGGAGRTNSFPRQEHSGHGREQALTSFKRVLYGIWTVPENSAVRYAHSTAGRAGAGSGAGPRDWAFQEKAHPQ